MSSYGATETEAGDENGIQKQTFSISEPYPDAPLRNYSLHARRSTQGGQVCDGFKIIVVSMFVFAVAVTVALIVQISYGETPNAHESEKTVSSFRACTKIGDEILSEGGNAVDAAVGASLCSAIVAPHLTGIGGGGLMLIHKHRINRTVVVDFRETAPEAASPDRYLQNPKIATIGRYSIAVPGFIKGLEHAHREHGCRMNGLNCVSWFRIVWKTISLAIQGFRAEDHFLNATYTKLDKKFLQSDDDAQYLRKFVQNLQPGAIYTENIVFRRLVDSLKNIAVNGSAAIYDGDIGKVLVDETGGFISLADLKNYTVVEREALVTQIGDYQVNASPAPSSGPKLLAFLNAMEKYNNTHGIYPIDVDYLQTVSRLLERLDDLQLNLADPANALVPESDNLTSYMLNKQNMESLLNEISGERYSPYQATYSLADPAGTHIAVMDRKDNYVSVVTSLNSWFGSKVMTSNGIILNNAMANFDIPIEDDVSPNQMSTGLRPLTPNVVAFAFNSKNVCGRRILSGAPSSDTLGQILSETLLANKALTDTIGEARILVRNSTVFVEGVYNGFDPALLAQLKMTKDEAYNMEELPYNAVNALDKKMDKVFQIVDFRGGDDF